MESASTVRLALFSPKKLFSQVSSIVLNEALQQLNSSSQRQIESVGTEPGVHLFELGSEARVELVELVPTSESGEKKSARQRQLVSCISAAWLLLPKTYS